MNGFLTRLRMIWAMATKRHFVCYAYDTLDTQTGLITGASETIRISPDNEETAMFLGAVGECIYEHCKEIENKHKKK